MKFENPKDHPQAEPDERALEKERIAQRLLVTAAEVNDRITYELRPKLRAGTLTDVDIGTCAAKMERYIFNEVCEALGLDALTRQRVLKEG